MSTRAKTCRLATGHKCRELSRWLILKCEDIDSTQNYCEPMIERPRRTLLAVYLVSLAGYVSQLMS